MKKLWGILLVILLSPQIVKAQISFDPGEGCLNVVDFTAGKVSGSLAATVSQPNMFMKGLSMSNLVSGLESVTVISIVITSQPFRFFSAPTTSSWTSDSLLS